MANPRPPYDTQPNASTEVEIKLVAIPVSIIDSIIPPANATAAAPQNNDSFLGKKFKAFKNYQKGGNTRYVRMPKHEYDMFWARDVGGRYIGTEPDGCDEGRRLLKLRLEDEAMQSVGKKNVSIFLCR